MTFELSDYELNKIWGWYCIAERESYTSQPRDTIEELRPLKELLDKLGIEYEQSEEVNFKRVGLI